jgi:hypothetical protein
MGELKNKIRETVNAAILLVNNKLYKEAAVKFWIAVRSSIFYHLKEEGINYASTQEALKIIVLRYGAKKISDDIIFVETIGTLSEWDEYFQISEKQIVDFANICADIISKFAHIEIYEQNEHELLKEEIERHKEDVEFAKATHYAAAMRNEKWYNLWLFWGFFITLLGVSCFLCSVSKLCCFFENWIGQFITLLGACFTLCPLIKDYSGKAVNHRRFAEAYNSIHKNCINWQSDFPDVKNIAEAKGNILIIRNSINYTNSLSPKTKTKDYVKGQQSIKSGSYVYNNASQTNSKLFRKMQNSVNSQNDISEKQNTPESIQLLKAQRVIYTIAKRWGYIDVSIAFLSIVSFICSVFFIMERQIPVISYISSIMATIIIVLISVLQKNKITIAAGIQEKLDNDIFGIPQNKILTPEYPSVEIIAGYAAKYKRDDMSNWYNKNIIDGYPHPIAVLRCQLTNLLWDKEQRKSFKTAIIILLILTIFALFLICYTKNYPFQDCMRISMIISPLIIYLIKNWIGQRGMLEDKENIVKQILSLMDRYKKENDLPTEMELRDIQNSIYNQRLQAKSTISDLWYRIRKKKTRKYIEQVFTNL